MKARDLELYIFNCVARYEPVLRHYREDALQEIRLAILSAKSEKESLRLSNRACGKMLRQLGHRRNGVIQRYKAHILHQYALTVSQLIFN